MIVPYHAIRVTASYHCGISRGGLCFFSLGAPYTGCLRFISAGDGVLSGPAGLVRETRDWIWTVGESCVAQDSYRDYTTGELVGKDLSADFPGIYLRHFDWKVFKEPSSTLRVSLWYPFFLFSILPACWAIRREWAKRQAAVSGKLPTKTL